MANLATALAISSVHFPSVIAAPDNLIILIIYAPILYRVDSIEGVDRRPKVSFSMF